jgi:lipopolysaccharide assembly outer membrane protein LptD (OstA)
MNTKSLLVGLVLSLPLPLVASTSGTDLLLKGNAVTVDGEKTVATEGASVVGRNNEARIIADKIVLDRSSGTLSFSGHVTIQSAGLTVMTEEATLTTEGKRVFVLSRGQISLSGEPALAPKEGARYVPLFTEPFPKTETALPVRR